MSIKKNTPEGEQLHFDEWCNDILSLITGSKFGSWNSFSYSSLDRSVNKTLFRTWNHLERLFHGCSLLTTTTMLAG